MVDATYDELQAEVSRTHQAATDTRDALEVAIWRAWEAELASLEAFSRLLEARHAPAKDLKWLNVRANHLRIRRHNETAARVAARIVDSKPPSLWRLFKPW